MPSQAAESDEGGEVQLDEVRVTGSRILRRDYESSSPIVTVGSDQLEQTSNVALEATLNKLPQFVPALSQLVTNEIQATAVATIGAATVNLRGLGTNRNVVILDGRRAMPVNASLTVDLNSIPSAAIDRVEVITGGASSTYGADAVGGVVNFILKKNFQGAQIDAQYGITQRGDAEEARLSSLVGGNFADGRGNAMLGGEFYDRGSARLIDHRWARERMLDPTIQGTDFWWSETSYMPPAGAGNAALQPSAAAIATIFGDAPAGANIPRTSAFFLNDDGSVYAGTNQTWPGGATGSSPFNPGGTYRYNGPQDGLFRKRQANGALGQNDIGAYLSSPMRRYSAFGRASFDISEDLSFFTQATLSQTRVDSLSQFLAATGVRAAAVPYGAGRNCMTIGVTNGVCQDTDAVPAGTLPFAQRATLPQYLAGGSAGLSCAATGGCANSQAFPVATYSPELAFLLDSRQAANAPWQLHEVMDWLPPRQTVNTTNTYQITTGLLGNLPVRDWTWEAYVSHGQSMVSTLISSASLDRWRSIATAPNFGRGFVGHQNLDDLINGIPQPGAGSQGARITCTSGLPILQDFAVSQDCIDALAVTLQNRQKMEQTIYEAVAQGSLADIPAGDLRYAAGVTWRRNAFEFLTDGLTSNGNFIDSAIGIFPAGNAAGTTTAREIYGELLVPVLSDLPLVQSATLELGYRHSDYNPTGAVGTYKALLDWRLNDSLRIRGGHQLASRAPNVGELYQGRTQLFGVVSPPNSDHCSLISTNPRSANPGANPDAASARALCESMMGAAGAAFFYDPAREQTTGAGAIAQAEGNLALEEEKARTWTVGLVARLPLEHPLVRSMQFTADWYQIKLKNAIASPTGDLVMNRCFSRDTNPNLSADNLWCRQIERSPDTGTIAVTNVQYSNESSIETAGYDFQFDWRVRPGELGAQGLPGTLSLNLQATVIDKFLQKVSATSPALDWKGALGPNNVGVQGAGVSFDYRLFATLGYNNGPMGVTLRYRYTPPAIAANEVTNPGGAPGGDPIPTGAPSYSIFDLSGSWAVNSTLSLRAGVDNLLDRDPPRTGRNTVANNGMDGGSFLPAGAGIFDLLGRRFYVGLRATF